MKSVRRVCACGLVGAVLMCGGCHSFHAHWDGGGSHWNAHGCGDGDGALIFLGVLGIAAGINALVEACRCR